MHCRCIFHLHTQEWSSIPRKGIDQVEKNCLILLKEWVDSWIFEIDREEQYKDSLKKFKEVVIKHSSKMKKTVPHVMTIVNSLEKSDTYWAKCYKKCSLDMEQATSSPGESMNSSMKRQDKGNMSKKNLQKSSDSMLGHSKYLETKRKAVAAGELNKKKGKTTII